MTSSRPLSHELIATRVHVADGGGRPSRESASRELRAMTMRVRDGEMAMATARRERCSWSDSSMRTCDGCNDPICDNDPA